MSGTTSGGTHAEKTAENPTNLAAARAAELARVASRKLAVLSEATRNALLEAAAKRLEENAARIASANANDVGDAEELVQAGQMSGAMLARLRVTEKSVHEMADRVRGVAKLADPLGRRLAVKIGRAHV